MSVDSSRAGGGASGTGVSAGIVVPAAALGGALFGLVDTLRTVLADTLARDLGRALLLAAIDAGSLALVGAVGGLAAWLLLRSRLGRGMKHPVAGGLQVGLSFAYLLDAGEAWFRAPAPFTQAPPLHGNPLVFALGVAVIAVICVGVAFIRSRALVFSIALLSLSLMVGHAVVSRRSVPRGHQDPPADAPNVLLVTMDTSRADYFGAYGRTDVQTPNFDALATQGLLMDNAFSQIPVTGPSHTTMMTGRTPWEHGNLLNGLPIDPAYHTLAQQLRDAGYRTAAFVSAYVLDGGLGFSRGFEVYDDDFGWLQGWDATVPGRVLAMAERFTNPDLVLERIGGRTTDQALAWLDANASGNAPFFTWVHLFDPHGPYEPPPPWNTAYYQGDPRDPAHTSMQDAQHIASYLKPSLAGITDADYVLAQYAGEVSYTDSQVGRLVAWLDASGHADDTVLIVLADHGESLAGDHGVWFNHGDDLYEAATWIPWVIRLPDGQHAGEKIEQMVELTDLAPTIYDLVGIDTPSTVTGQSLVPSFSGGDHRAYARGMCFDRPVNRDLRSKGEIKDPTWRVSALRFPNNRFVDHEYGDLPSENWSIHGQPPNRVEQRAPIAIPVENQLTDLTQQLFSENSVERSQVQQSEDAIKKLQALGYMEK
ncbi:MAG: sulfatase-like hydrolase/transferase [Oligoflexia bacterium]|nr:sulfatase-like hydrolase/transferase [Oligoflexia bacterium]